MGNFVDRRLRQFATARPAKRAGLILILLAVFTVAGTSAWAYWTTVGNGTASATTGTLQAPTNPVASYTTWTSTVGLTWTASTGTPAPTGYYATRVKNSDSTTAPACATSASSLTTGASCTDLLVPDGTFHYTVTAVYHSWTAPSLASGDVAVSNDVIAPTVSASRSPAANGNGYNNTSPVAVNLTAIDNVGGSGVASITSWIDAGTHTTVSGSAASVSVTGQGAHVVSFFATDNAGNAGTTQTQSVNIDMIAPSVTNVTSPDGDGVYKTGGITVTVAFTEAVTVTGTPTLSLASGSPATTSVSYLSGTGTNVLTFQYVIAAGNASADLDYASTSALALNGGTIQDAASNGASLTLASPGAAGSLGFNKNIAIDTTSPTVTGVSSTLVDGSYKAGQVVPVTLTFSELVQVTGNPRLTLSTGSPGTTAVNYTGGSGSNVLTFNYTVVALNTSADLDYAATTSLALNGGFITDPATNNANLTLASPGAPGSLGANKNLVIDTTAPTVSINQAVGQLDPTNNGSVAFTAVFSEPVIGFTSGAVTVTGTAGGTKTVVVTGSGPTYAVTVNGATGDGTIIASIGANAAQDPAGNNNTALASSDNKVTLDTTPPVVTLTSNPSSPNGANSWFKSAVTWTPSGSDANGLPTCQAALPYSTPDSAAASVTRTCTDTAGNVGTATATFKYDATAPSGSVTSPVSAASVVGTAVAVTSNAADTTSGVSSVQFQVKPAAGAFTNLGAADTTSPYATTWDTTSVVNGSYLLQTVVTDGAGNTFTSGSTNVTVANAYDFVVSNPGAQVAGTPFGSVTLQLRVNGVSSTTFGGTTYAGPKPITFSGPGTSPAGTAPIYPSTVNFVNGLGTVGAGTITLTTAQSTTLTATMSSDGVAGTSGNFTVAAGLKALQFSPGCGSWDTKKKSGGNGTTTVSVTRGKDSFGNTATDNSALTVTMGATGGSWSAGSLTFALNGTTTTGSSIWSNPGSQGITSTATASATGYVTATCSYPTTP